jgi:hypothetical protein
LRQVCYVPCQVQVAFLPLRQVLADAVRCRRERDLTPEIGHHEFRVSKPHVVQGTNSEQRVAGVSTVLYASSIRRSQYPANFFEKAPVLIGKRCRSVRVDIKFANDPPILENRYDNLRLGFD